MKAPRLSSHKHIIEQANNLIVCPNCDAIYSFSHVEPGEVSRCQRCNTVLATPRKQAGMRIIMIALTVFILVFFAIFSPFLAIETNGLSNRVSLLETALAYSEGMLTILVVITAAMIVVFPALRAALIIYVIAPLVFDRPPAPGALVAFRWAQDLRPWSMAEIFALGCAISLVKITDLANVIFGPAFWMFNALVILVILQRRFMCDWSVWHALLPRS